MARSVLVSLHVPISLQAGLSFELAGPAVTEDRTDTSAISITVFGRVTMLLCVHVQPYNTHKVVPCLTRASSRHRSSSVYGPGTEERRGTVCAYPKWRCARFLCTRSSAPFEQRAPGGTA